MARLTLLFAVLLCLLGGCSRAPAPDGTLVLTYASPYPATHTFSRADQAWMDFIAKESGGRIRIKPYWGGALLSSNENMLEIRHGVADIGMITPMYARSAHLQRIQPSFYSGVGTMADQIAVYRCLAETYPAFNAEVRGLHVLAVQGGNFPGILTRNRPVRTLADLKGLRLRAQEDTANVLRALGADPVNMSMAEVYPSMAKGVIDGVITPVDALKSMHLADVANYYTTLRIPRGAYPARAMGEKVWRRLSAADQALFTRAEAVWEAAMISGLDQSVAVSMEYAKGAGLSFIAPAPGAQEEFDDLYRANATRLGATLGKLGIPGRQIAEHATALVAARTAGQPLDCGKTQ